MSTQLVTVTFSAEAATLAEPGDVQVISEGSLGPQGPPVAIVPLTQAEYDALPVKNPTTFYVIIP